MNHKVRLGEIWPGAPRPDDTIEAISELGKVKVCRDLLTFLPDDGLAAVMRWLISIAPFGLEVHP